MNPFDNILTPEFTSLFDRAIDTILDSNNGLVNDCILKYGAVPSEQQLCNNCIFDSISLLSSNIYNGFGPAPFLDGSMCPVCFGSGYLDSSSTPSSASEEHIKLAVITDLKYFINIADKVNISSNSIQTISPDNILYKLNNAISLVVNGISYQKSSAPQMCGLSKHKYTIITWSPQ